MIKSVGFVIGKDEYTHEEIVERFRGQHVDLGEQLPNLVRYTTSVPRDPPGQILRRDGGSSEFEVPEGGLVEYDLISELWFENWEDYREAFPSEASREAFEDEREFVDEIYFLTVEEAVHVAGSE
jgi:uncharacterized protein (TIGR02118 family)